MKHIKGFNESEQYWQKQAREAKERRDLKSKYPLLGKRVRRRGRSKWEEGTIVLDNFEGQEEELFIEFGQNDREQLFGLPFQIWDDSTESWVEG